MYSRLNNVQFQFFHSVAIGVVMLTLIILFTFTLAILIIIAMAFLGGVDAAMNSRERS